MNYESCFILIICKMPARGGTHAARGSAGGSTSGFRRGRGGGRGGAQEGLRVADHSWPFSSSSSSGPVLLACLPQ
jgi:hypothetical protein